MMDILNKKAFTLVELVIIMIIIGSLIAIALPRYHKSIEQAHERDAMIQLRALHAVQELYQQQTGGYYPQGGNTSGLNAINNDLEMNLMANGMDYQCVGGGSTPNRTYTCTATRQSPATAFTIELTEQPLSENNPTCLSGSSCP